MFLRIHIYYLFQLPELVIREQSLMLFLDVMLPQQLHGGN